MKTKSERVSSFLGRVSDVYYITNRVFNIKVDDYFFTFKITPKQKTILFTKLNLSGLVTKFMPLANNDIAFDYFANNIEEVKNKIKKELS